MEKTLLVFAGVCWLLAMIPGPGAMVILRQAVRDGRGPAFMTLLGNETALVLWGVAAAGGFTALITASHMAYDAMRLVSAIVLVVQALVSGRRSPAADADAGAGAGELASPDRREGSWRAYSVGLIANLTNPKAAVFALSFLPQFVPPGYPTLATMTALSVVWALVDALWFTLVIWFIGKARAYFSRDRVRRRLTQFSGVVLIGLALRLVFESQ